MNSSDFAAEAVRATTLNKGKQSRYILAQTGVDIEVLEQVYDIWLEAGSAFDDYIGLEKAVRQISSPSCIRVFEESGIDDSQNVITLLDGHLLQRKPQTREWRSLLQVPEMYRVLPSEEIRYGEYAVFLTSERQWIGYVNFPKKEFRQFASPRSLIDWLCASMLPGTHYGSKANKKYNSLAIEIAERLTISVRESFNCDKRRIDVKEPIHWRMKEYMDTIDPE